MQIVTTPTERWLLEKIRECRSRVIIASPFVTGLLNDALSTVPPSAKRILITKADLRNFALGVSDLDAVCDFARKGGDVRSLPRLHAKVYVIDRHCALVTSANATYGGLRRNLECGIAAYDQVSVADIARSALGGFGSGNAPSPWTLKDLDALRKPVSAMRQLLPALPPPRPATPDSSLVSRQSVDHYDQLVSSFHGWTALVLEQILAQESDTFSLDSLLMACEPLAARHYPRNQHVREKLRQQLQRLRDLGIVDFLGEGRYLRTIDTLDLE